MSRRRHNAGHAVLGTGAPVYTPTKLAASVGEGTQTKAQVDAFNAMIAPRKLDRLMFFTSLEGTVLREEFKKLMEETGMEEMVLAWLPSNNAASVSYTKEIIEGKKDAAIKAALEEMKAWGKPIILRLGHEFNGNWYPWGAGFGTKTEATGVNKKGETAAEFIEWWKRIFNIAVEVGCPNVSFAWNPNTWGGAAEVDPAPYYPGDAYVHLVGVDNYMTAGHPPRTPSAMFKSPYESIHVYSSKPFCIFETGCCPTGEGEGGTIVKTTWDNELAALLTTEIPVAHFGYWNRHKAGESDYRIDSGGADIPAREAFKAMVNNPRFV